MMECETSFRLKKFKLCCWVAALTTNEIALVLFFQHGVSAAAIARVLMTERRVVEGILREHYGELRLLCSELSSAHENPGTDDLVEASLGF